MFDYSLTYECFFLLFFSELRNVCTSVICKGSFFYESEDYFNYVGVGAFQG